MIAYNHSATKIAAACKTLYSLSHPDRLKAVLWLFQEGESSVTQLQEALGIASQPNFSINLKVLLAAGLIRVRYVKNEGKRGNRRMYSLNPAYNPLIQSVIENTSEGQLLRPATKKKATTTVTT